MASKAHSPAQVCPVCLGSPTTQLKVIGSCKHAVCVNCLAVHLDKIPPGSKVLPCPTCQVESPLLGTSADSFVDYVEKVGEASTDGSPGIAAAQLSADDKARNEKQCLGCKHKTNEWVRAEYLCVDCGRVYFCKDCNQAHGTRKATQGHHVVHLENLNEKGFRCEMHGQVFNRYCSTCNEPVCSLCILFEHDDHTFREIRDICRELADKVTSSVKKQEERIKYLQNTMSGLNMLKDVVDGEKGALLKAVEDHSEKCIEQILKQKEALKVQIQTKLDIAECVSGHPRHPVDFHMLKLSLLQFCMGRRSIKNVNLRMVSGIPTLVNVLSESVKGANELLSRRDICPAARLEALSTAKAQLEACSLKATEIDFQPHWRHLETSHENIPDFVPSTVEFTLGTIGQRITSMSSTEKRVLEEYVIFSEKTYEVEDSSKFIGSVVALGNEFAVAHPSKAGEPADAIDIYDYPMTLKRTLHDHVYPLHAMVRSPVRKLVVLSHGTQEGYFCVKLFDPLAGYVRSSADFQLKGTLLSFDVNQSHQFVILTDLEEQRLITIYRGDGTVVFSQILDQNLKVKFNCIACLGNSYTITGGGVFVVYTKKGGHVQLNKTFGKNISDSATVQHVSASGSGLVFSYFYSQVNCLGRVAFSNGGLSGFEYKGVGNAAVGADINTRISQGNNYIVASQGHTVRVLTPP